MRGFSELEVFLIRRAYESELTILREQVKVLREVLEADCKICVKLGEFNCCATCPTHKALEQTKPKDGE